MRHTTTAASARIKRVLVPFPENLLRQTDEAARQLSTNRSKLIRTAVQFFLERRKMAQLAKDLAAGYAANADFDRQVAEEFAHLDADNL